MEFKKSQLWCKIAPKPVVQMTWDQAKVISFDKFYNLGNFGENFSRMMPPNNHPQWSGYIVFEDTKRQHMPV